MNLSMLSGLGLPTPAYIIDIDKLVKNLSKVQDFSTQTGCKVLYSLKGFSQPGILPVFSQFVCGIAASGLFEARLGSAGIGGGVHVHAPAYFPEEIDLIIDECDHIVFNSLAQWDKYRSLVMRKPGISSGLRINPEYSEVATLPYNPCYKHSRFGITADLIKTCKLDFIEGLHFHTMCEQDSDVLERTVDVVTSKFDAQLKAVQWLNMGGGHNIVSNEYDIQRFGRIVAQLVSSYGVQVYIEPCESIISNAAVLITRVLDIIDNGIPTAILDSSAICHYPCVIESPYELDIVDTIDSTQTGYEYILAGSTCLAGDILGRYKFPTRLSIDRPLIIKDMAAYSMTRNSTFTGINYPSVYLYSESSGIQLLKTYTYEHYLANQ